MRPLPDLIEHRVMLRRHCVVLLALPLAAADAHTALLSESAEGAISSVVASLTAGDRVELEWLQMRLPGAAFDSEPVRVCPKLARVTAAAPPPAAARAPARSAAARRAEAPPAGGAGAPRAARLCARGPTGTRPRQAGPVRCHLHLRVERVEELQDERLRLGRLLRSGTRRGA